MQRIPYGANGQNRPGKPVVFLQHGLLDASHTWVINFPNESLGVCLFCCFVVLFAWVFQIIDLVDLVDLVGWIVYIG
jgi:hypothetical protein